MDKPIIGIVTRPLKDTLERSVDTVTDTCRRAILKNGGIPVGILPTQEINYYDTLTKDIPDLSLDEKDMIISQIDLCDGIFMQGGKRWFKYDEFILDYATKNNIPLLGICMSMQLMGRMDLMNNGDMTPLIKVKGHATEGKYVHDIIIDKSSLLYEIVGKTSLQVNSRHSYALPYTKSLKVSATSSDGVVEAIENTSNNFTMGLQWHPELMISYDEDENKILKYFIDKAKKR